MKTDITYGTPALLQIHFIKILVYKFTHLSRKTVEEILKQIAQDHKKIVRSHIINTSIYNSLITMSCDDFKSS
jgi:replication-associated recombination protein RarA